MRDSPVLKYVVLTGLLLGGIASPSTIDDAVLLRRQLVPDCVSKYHFEMASKQSVTMPDGTTNPEVGISVSMDYVMKAGSELVNGRLPVTITVSNYRYESLDPMPGDIPKEVTMQGMLDDRNTITEVRMEKMDRKYRELMEASLKMLQNHIPFPEQPVKVGDTWDIVMAPSSTAPAKPTSFKMRFDGERKVGERSYWVVSSNETNPLDMDLSAMGDPTDQPPVGNIAMKGNMEVTMEFLFEKSGRLYSMVTGMKTDVKLETSQASGKVHVVGDIVSRMNLVE